MSTPVILVVEDDPVLRLVTQKQGEMLGYAVQLVESGEKAVEYDKAGICLIFMDIGLPGINGIEATLLIREQERRGECKHVPIIALTAHSCREECLSVGMDDFLEKPARLADIKQMIAKWALVENKSASVC